MSKVYIPSFNRSERVRTYEYLGEGNIIVPESQKKLYSKRYGKAVIAIPNERDGWVAKKRNAVLDLIQEREEDGYGWVCDDDLVCLRRKKENIKQTGEETLEHFDRILLMAKDAKAMYGGFDYSSDNIKLKDMSPFSLTKGVFQVALINAKDGIRYDERFRINEDVEFFIQKMNANRFMIRDNQYCIECYGVDGGNESTIGYDRGQQRKYATMINNKWGYKAMKWNKTRFAFHHPIKGT